MLTEKPSEIPNNSFETITDARDKRLQTRLGEIVRGKFEYYYSDLLQMKKFGLQIGINQRGEILLDGKEKGLDFVIAGYRIEGMRDNYTIPIGGTFRIYNGSDGSMNIEIIQPNEQPFIITISQKKQSYSEIIFYKPNYFTSLNVNSTCLRSFLSYFLSLSFSPCGRFLFWTG